MIKRTEIPGKKTMRRSFQATFVRWTCRLEPFRVPGVRTVFSWKAERRKVVQALDLLASCNVSDNDEPALPWTEPPGVFDNTSCLADRDTRPEVVKAHGVTVDVPTLASIAPRIHGGVVNKGLLDGNFKGPKPCVRELRKLIHTIWMGTPMRTKHAQNIVSTALLVIYPKGWTSTLLKRGSHTSELSLPTHWQVEGCVTTVHDNDRRC